MKLTLKGTSEYIDTTYQNKLVIKDDRISFSDQEHDGIHTHTLKVNTSNPQYRIGIDNSGGKYELVEFDTDNWYHSLSIVQRNKYLRETVSIQTWDRKSIFVWMRRNKKGHGRGKNWYADSSDVDTVIIDLDEESSEQLATWLDTLR